jgi:hypothetical protein
MSRTGSKPFAAYLHSVRSREIADLRLGKKTDELYAHARSCASRSTATPAADRPGKHLYRAAGESALPVAPHLAGRRPLQRPKRLRPEVLTRFTPTSGTPVVVPQRLAVKRRGASRTPCPNRQPAGEP